MATTMGARLGLALCLLSAPAIASGESVTESDALRLFLERSPQALRIPLVEQAAGDERRRDALLANPEIGYASEDAGGVRDEFLTVSQQVPLGGRRTLVRESADAAASAAGLAATRDLAAAAADVRAAFYEVLHRERAVENVREGLARVERVVEVLRQREAAGEGSGYDLLRAEQELDEVGVDLSAAEAAVGVARSRFGAYFDPEAAMHLVRLVGDLRPRATVPDTQEAIERAIANRADLRALRAEARSFELDHRAARRRRFPEPTVTAGWKRTESVGADDSGFVAGVALPLPVFDRGRLDARRADADRRNAELRATMLEREIRAEVRAALSRERAAREAVQRLVDAGDRAGELRRIATLAYEEGEAGILELLDAHRSSLATELRALGVLHEAKRSEIDRDRAIGTEVTP